MASVETTERAGRGGAAAERAESAHREAWTALCHAHASVTIRLQEALSEAGLPPLAWYEVLDAVGAASEEGIKMGDLAATLVISRGGLTKLVDRLVKAGLMERAFCETDRRVSYAVLTEAGREVFEEMRPVVVGELRSAFSKSLTASQAAALRDSLLKVKTTSCSA